LAGQPNGSRTLTRWSKELSGGSVSASPSDAARPELRVLEVFRTLGVGGAEIWLLELLKYFREKRSDLPFELRIDVCLTGGVPGPLDQAASELGAQLHYIRYTGSELPSFTRQYRALLREHRYHVIHDQQDHSAGLRLLMSVGLWSPVRIVHFHNPLLIRRSYNTGPLRSAATFAGYQLVRKLATHILGTSADTLREHRVDASSVPRRVTSRALYCGFDVSQFSGDVTRARQELRGELGFQPQDRIVLFVGRLNTHSLRQLNQKNPQFAIEVGAKCVARDSTIKLVVAGAGADDLPQLRSFIEERGLKRSVLLIGPRSDVPRLMLGSDLLLLPSLAEGLGLVAVEAQAAGLPVLASEAVPDEAIVIPGAVSRLALNAGPAAWAESVARLLKTSPSASGWNAEVGASPFAIENSAEQLLSIYAEALRNTPKRSG
jgi:glycosyltransferase involved in cell wall biosynthesis